MYDIKTDKNFAMRCGYCGHPKAMHYGGRGMCSGPRCHCSRFERPKKSKDGREK